MQGTRKMREVMNEGLTEGEGGGSIGQVDEWDSMVGEGNRKIKAVLRMA